MRLIDRLISRYQDTYWEGEASGAAILTTTYGAPDREAVLPAFMTGTRTSFKSNGVVFSAILVRAALFSEARFQFQRTTDKDLFGDTRLRVLERPWPDGNAGELLTRMEQDVSLAGNFYLWNGGDQLVRWRPDWVTIISRVADAPNGGWYREVIGYHYEPPKAMQPEFGDPQTVPTSEVVHWAPMPDPEANWRGMSWLTPVVREAQADNGMTSYKQRYLENAATPNMLIKYSQKLQPGTIDAIRERIQARFGGVSNAYKTLILDQGADATVIGNSLQELDFSNVQSAGAERILAAASVPGILVGLETLKGAGKSYQDVVRRFADLWARPQWRSACGRLQKFTPGGDIDAGAVRLWYDTSDIAALQDGEQQRAQQTLIHAQAALTYRNAGFTRQSVVASIQANDITLLVADPDAPPPGPATSQHMLPQPPGSGPGVEPLPAGAQLRLPAAAPGVSPGSQGRETVPAQRPASVRRGLNGANGHGQDSPD